MEGPVKKMRVIFRFRLRHWRSAGNGCESIVRHYMVMKEAEYDAEASMELVKMFESGHGASMFAGKSDAGEHLYEFKLSLDAGRSPRFVFDGKMLRVEFECSAVDLVVPCSEVSTIDDVVKSCMSGWDIEPVRFPEETGMETKPEADAKREIPDKTPEDKGVEISNPLVAPLEEFFPRDFEPLRIEVPDIPEKTDSEACGYFDGVQPKVNTRIVAGFPVVVDYMEQ